MNNNPNDVIIEKTFNAPVDRVWRALTDPEQMKQWYFDLPGFKAEVGYEFAFVVSNDKHEWSHLCKVTEVKHQRLISYTWRYEGYAGDSLVRFELFDEGGKTRLVLTHSGLHTFPANVEALKRENFVAGWTEIVNTSLTKFLHEGN